MKELLEKVTSYNLFNYLLPGVLYVVLIGYVTDYQISTDNIVVDVFVWYFLGMVISRLGSLVVEPFLKYIKFVRFKEYKEFILASKSDSKLGILSEQNNTYRTLTALFLMVVLTRLYEIFANWIGLKPESSTWVILVLLLITFLIAYRKQTAYIRQRIESNFDDR